MTVITDQQLLDKAEQCNVALKNYHAENRERFDGLETRIGDVETILSRPGFGGRGGEPQDEKRLAFFNWCRRGGERMTPEHFAVLTEGDDTGGGYLAPPEYVQEIIKGIVEFSPLRSIARVRQTSQGKVQIPKRTGQFSAVWVAEQGTKAETTGLAYGLEEIPAQEMYALIDISNSDLEDSDFDIEAELNAEFTEQFGVAEGTAFVTGDAIGKPEGFLNNADVGSTNSGDANLITADSLIELYHAVKTGHAVRGTWVLNRTTLGEVRKLKDGMGNYLWQPGIAGGAPPMILGQPYVEMTDMPDVAAAANPIAFGNFRRAYLIVDRVIMAVVRDALTQATSGNIRFIARRRVGGQVVLAEAIRKLTIAA